MKKRAVLAYQYGMSNAGDFAITVGAIDYLLRHYETIDVISKYTAEDSDYMEAQDYFRRLYGSRVTLYPGPFALNRSSGPAQLKSYAGGLMKVFSAGTRRFYSELIAGADCVYINGGNLLRCESLTDLIRLEALLYPAGIARSAHTALTFLPQSTTSINRAGYLRIRGLLSCSKAVLVRESISYDYLKNRFPDIAFQKIMDMAFFIDNRQAYREKCEKTYPWLFQLTQKPVAITLRKEKIGDIGEFPQEKQDLIRSEMSGLIGEIQKHKVPLLFVIQTEKDRAFTEELHAAAAKADDGHSVYVLEEHDPLLLREIYANVSVLVGMRLHSIILAASVQTPVVGYFDPEWGNKNPGILQELGMPYARIGEEPAWAELLGTARENNRLIDFKESEMKKLDELVLSE